MPRKHHFAGLAAMWMASLAFGQSLICAEDQATFANTCFHKDRVRSNGDFRATTIYRGGPNSITETSFTARVYCPAGTMELTDKTGVAFARNVPGTQSGKDFVRFLCDHKKTKPDKTIRTG